MLTQFNFLPFYPVLVVGYIFSIKQLIRGWVFAQSVFRCGTRVHEGLSHHRQTRICDAALMNVKNELGILDHIHPETQRKAAGDRQTQTQKEKSYIGLNCRHWVKTNDSCCSWGWVLCMSVSSHQLLFQVWRTSVSLMPCLSACSSRKSNMYLIANGSALPLCTVLKRVSNRSSTNFCSVP